MIYPTRAFYRPGETATINIPGQFEATIWRLSHKVATISGVERLEWTTPPVVRRGYRVHAITEAGEFWTAFDILDCWTDAPRYGYLFDFQARGELTPLDQLLAYHINGIQFYDWMYRHDTLLPPESEFVDPLGRKLSLDTVRRLIDAAHQLGMTAMPYTAIYAASPEFAKIHPDWGLYDDNGVLYDFADGFLKLMNPDSGWRDHFIAECHSVLDALPFDGVHVDQYGEPQTGFTATGEALDMPEALAGTLRALHDAIPADKALLFNLVHNWPLDAIAKTPVDFLYCEIWSPSTTLGDLAHITKLNRDASGGKTPVVAVYINPDYDHTAKLVECVILASGGCHIVHGEDGLYLCDPYFPNSTRPSPELADYLQRVADFGVAYEELLSFAEPITLQIEVSSDLWAIPRRNGNLVALNLLNASPTDQWNSRIEPRDARTDTLVVVTVDEPVTKIWSVSPDTLAPPFTLDFEQAGGKVSFTAPIVDTWTLICIELTE
jgi:dextranase